MKKGSFHEKPHRHRPSMMDRWVHYKLLRKVDVATLQYLPSSTYTKADGLDDDDDIALQKIGQNYFGIFTLYKCSCTDFVSRCPRWSCWRNLVLLLLLLWNIILLMLRDMKLHATAVFLLKCNLGSRGRR